MPSYQKIGQYFRKQQFVVKYVNIDWPRKVMTDYVSQFEEQYQSDSKSKICFFGFSYGAMIAFMAAVKLKPYMLILASLSPYFSEDLPRIPQYWKTFVGKRRVACFQTLRCSAIAKQITAPTILLFGEKEPIQVAKRAEQIVKLVHDVRIVTCPQAKHDLNAAGYLNTLKQVIGAL